MYSILIVEDEEVFRNVLPRIIDWSSLGFRVAGTAANGREALDFCRRSRIDVVLTDIKMPVLNGIELAMELKLQSVGTKVVLLSAFEDFEYARKGIACGVHGYILKSEGEEEIERYFSRMKVLLDEERSQGQDSENMWLDQKRRLEDFLACAHPEDAAFLDDIRSARALAIVDLDERHALERRYGSSIVRELMRMLRLGAYELVDKEGIGLVSDLGNRIAVIALRGDVDPFPFFVGLHGELNSRLAIASIDEAMVPTISLSACAVKDGGSGLKDAFDLASSGIAAKASLGPGAFIKAPENAAAEGPSFPSEARLAEELRDVLRKIRADGLSTPEIAATRIIEFLDGVEARAKAARLGSMLPVTAFAARALVILTKERESPAAEVPGFAAALDPLLTELGTYETASMLLGRLKQGVVEAFESLGPISGPKGTKLVREAVACMQAGYQGSISLESVAARLKVHPVHLSRVFSRHYGKTFTVALAEIRIEAAKGLLADSRYKIYEVADLVGFEKPKYFSELFKKMTGYTPNDYRGRFT
jgi:AraC-like DNA-binding protein/CheY-like chemotaxis protein